MAHVLVTGVAGFIGSHTADQLLDAGHRVTGADNFRTGLRENLAHATKSPRFALHELDVAADGALDRLVAETRPDAIVHLAALVSVQESIHDPELNYTLNVRATHLVIEAARRHRVPRIVFASSAAVYGNATALPIKETTPTLPISPYGGAKLASEGLLLGAAAAFDLTVRCQRYFNVFGPRQDPKSPYSGVISIFQRAFREGKPVTVFGDGTQTRDFVSVHDVARANVLAATRPDVTTGIANICTGTGTSLNAILAVLRERYPGSHAPQYASPRVGDIWHSRGSPAAAKEALGFEARLSLEEALGEMAHPA